MKQLILISLLCFSLTSFSQSEWPRTITTSTGAKIIVYQPQPEHFQGAKLTGRAAVSVRTAAAEEPTFGAFWFDATLLTSRDTRIATLESLKITSVKIPGVEDSARIVKFRKLLETEIPKWELNLSLDQLITSIEQEQGGSSDELKNDPPKIIYATTPTTLVIVDGQPKLEKDEQLNMQRVINTPFLILQSKEDNQFYLSGGKFWYVSASVLEGWQSTKTLPTSIEMAGKLIASQDKSTSTTSKQEGEKTPRAIVVSTEPVEIIQTRGAADMASIQGTSLLYVANSEDEIFMDINTQKYYVLLSGRWYTAGSLQGPWSFVAADQLPSDFKKIPEGSAKDNVLSSVAGTQAAQEAVMDAKIPQTAKVDRQTATCTVVYNGEPMFEKIEGTSMLVALNTSSTVLQSGNKYFCVENGVWFESAAAKGPWKVSTERPADVDKIPASSTAYNTKYVYIYESTPQYVYVGYTPGYMGCYVYGPTVIYGTGYYYNPWYGPYYYPHPVTYGYSMHYNPYTGWSMGFHYSTGYFHVGYVHGGYWGPPMYRPPYHPPYHGGYYGHGTTINHYGNTNINIDRSNNIYNNRKDVSTRDVPRGNTGGNTGQPRTSDLRTGNKNQPNNRGGQGPQNNVYSDKQGNVYQKQNDGNWQQRNNNQWQNSSRDQQSSLHQLDRDQQNRNRAQTRDQNFNQSNRGGNLGGNRTGGGGRRR